MPDDAQNRAMRALTDLGELRVWSLLVTVFGDLAPDGPLDGPTLSAIMGRISIKPQATRVALHRLRSDGWIMSEKRGRTSLHSLTKQGKTDSTAAAKRIYATPDQIGQTATLLLTEHSDVTPDPSQFTRIAPRLFICAADAVLPENVMRLAPVDQEIPAWISAQIQSAPLCSGYHELHRVLTDIDTALPDRTQLEALDSAVLRVMIVHAWRRLCLRHPALPRHVHSPDWRGHDCRALVTRLLSRFPRPTPDRINSP